MDNEIEIPSFFEGEELAAVKMGSTTLKMSAIDMAPFMMLFKKIESGQKYADNGQFTIYEVEGRVIMEYRAHPFTRSRAMKIGAMDRAEVTRAVRDMSAIVSARAAELRAQVA